MREKPLAFQAASADSASSEKTAAPSAVTVMESAVKPFWATPPSVW